MVNNTRKYISTKEAAKILGFSHSHLRWLIREGKIKGAEKISLRWVLKITSLPEINRNLKRNKKPVKKTEMKENGNGTD